MILAAVAIGVSVAALEDIFAVTLFPFGPYIGELINWYGNAGYLVLLLLAPIYWLIVAIHEAAHSVAGVMTGLSWQGVSLGRVLIQKRKRGVRLRWEKHNPRGGGFAYFSCPQPEHPQLRRKFILTTAAGPLSTLLIAVGALSLNRVMPYAAFGVNELYLGELITGFTLTTLGAYALYLFAAGLYPFYKNIESDGARLWRLFGRQLTEVDRQELRLEAQFYSVLRPRDWDEKVLAACADHTKPNVAVFSAVFSYYRALDQGELERAAQSLERALTYLPDLTPSFAANLQLEAAYFWAWHQRDLDTATDWFDKGAAIEARVLEQGRAKAALYLLQGEPEEALSLVARVLRDLEGAPESGIKRAEVAWLEDMKARALSAIQARTAGHGS